MPDDGGERTRRNALNASIGSGDVVGSGAEDDSADDADGADDADAAAAADDDADSPVVAPAATHSDAICRCENEGGEELVVCQDGDATFPITTTVAPIAGCPADNADLTLREDGCACRTDTSSSANWYNRGYSMYGRYYYSRYNYYSYVLLIFFPSLSSPSLSLRRR